MGHLHQASHPANANTVGTGDEDHAAEANRPFVPARDAVGTGPARSRRGVDPRAGVFRQMGERAAPLAAVREAVVGGGHGVVRRLEEPLRPGAARERVVAWLESGVAMVDRETEDLNRLVCHS